MSAILRSDFRVLRHGEWTIGTQTSATGQQETVLVRFCTCGRILVGSVTGLGGSVDPFPFECRDDTLFKLRGCGIKWDIPDEIACAAQEHAHARLNRAASIRAKHGGPSQFIPDC